jgi:hypothetical protein
MKFFSVWYRPNEVEFDGLFFKFKGPFITYEPGEKTLVAALNGMTDLLKFVSEWGPLGFFYERQGLRGGKILLEDGREVTFEEQWERYHVTSAPALRTPYEWPSQQVVFEGYRESLSDVYCTLHDLRWLNEQASLEIINREMALRTVTKEGQWGYEFWTLKEALIGLLFYKLTGKNAPNICQHCGLFYFDKSRPCYCSDKCRETDWKKKQAGAFEKERHRIGEILRRRTKGKYPEIQGDAADELLAKFAAVRTEDNLDQFKDDHSDLLTKRRTGPKAE